VTNETLSAKKRLKVSSNVSLNKAWHIESFEDEGERNHRPMDGMHRGNFYDFCKACHRENRLQMCIDPFFEIWFNWFGKWPYQWLDRET
jgi:hypothetical protein